jgi:drug/metabolite transporter superfamily protein YnfA
MARSPLVSLAYEFWSFLRVRKKWWLAPIVIIMALFGSLIVFTHGSALAPFIYTVF